ncbi:MAG: YqiA/YcfP family alpha/beta fold hydrolase [Sulfurimonadaceae bacterium]
MILYLHGFASCGDSTKTCLLKKYFGADNVYSPDLPVQPTEAIAFIDKIINEKNINMLIGSSLGGYYASYFCEKYAIKTVLINPSTEPYETLKPYVGNNTYWCSGEPFEWKKSYLGELQIYNIETVKEPSLYLLLLQKGDEVLDYSKALEKYEGATLSVEEGGNHRFENLDEHLERIKDFYEFK